MSTEGFSPALVDQYGGLCTLIDRSDLPIGLSPDCQNVEFFPGGVRSRSGFAVSKTIANNVVDLQSYTTASGARKLLILDEYGGITGGAVDAAPAAIPFGDVAATTTALGSDLRMRGTTAFGRAFFGLHGQAGVASRSAPATDLLPVAGPFQYDGVSITPASQAPPPAVFTVANVGGGSMSAGRHDFVVAYETSTGYVTAPSAPVGDTFTLNDKADIAALPSGPGAITKRIIFATPANSTSFFTLPRFAVVDNTTATASLDFTDAELISGASLEDYIESARIPPVLGVEKYGSRMVYWGGASRLQSFFDASATVITQPVVVGFTCLDFDEQKLTLPAPWVATGAGGAVVVQAGASLQVYQITGDGASATRGQIDQVAANVALSGTYYMAAQRRYGIRIRVRKNTTLVAGSLVITLRGSSTNVAGSGTTLATLTVSAAALYDEWTTVETALPGTALAANYAFVNVTVVASGTPTNGGIVQIDTIDIYDVTAPYSRSILWITPPDSPETLNLATGVLAVAEDDGEKVTNVFELRGNLYICKEHALYVTTDNGDEPYTWTVDQVSNVVGAAGPNGVSVGDGWALLVDRDGLYRFAGGVPEKLSQEIQPTWSAFGWGYGELTWIATDPGARRVYMGIPAGGVTKRIANMYVLDYVEGFNDPVSSGGSGRKWTAWVHGSGSELTAGTIVETAAHTGVFYFGVGLDVVAQNASSVSDVDSTPTTYPILSHYETAPIGTEIGRSLFDRVVMRIRGSGSLVTQYRTPGGTLTTLPTKTLTAAPDDDVEILMRTVQTQAGYRIGTSGVTDYWSLRRLGVFTRVAEYTSLRKT